MIEISKNFDRPKVAGWSALSKINRKFTVYVEVSPKNRQNLLFMFFGKSPARLGEPTPIIWVRPAGLLGAL
jgi:hypothetical protein